MPGLSDTLIQHQIFGMANPHGVSALINPYAAMPSLHVGWALWCAAAFEVASQSAWRHLVWLYPLLTTMVVLATANHYLLDALAGAALVVAALTLTHRTTSPIVAVRESF
jgi:divalent metal cation (Fe/Co/Zn/Cd) transporter